MLAKLSHGYSQFDSMWYQESTCIRNNKCAILKTKFGVFVLFII